MCKEKKSKKINKKFRKHIDMRFNMVYYMCNKLNIKNKEIDAI